MIAVFWFNVLMPTIFVVWAAFLVAMELTTVRRARRYVERSAAAMSYHLQSVKLRRLPTGPWGYWYNGASTHIFEMVVTEPSGGTRTAFARVSGGLFGLIADDIEWRWAPPAGS